MKSLYLILIILAACCAYVYALQYQAQHLFPKFPPVSVGAVTVDGAIDASKWPHLVFASKETCITPESYYCWDSEPEIEVQ